MKKVVLTLEQVMAEYDKKITKTIKKFHFKSQSVEDIKQSIFLKMLETDYISKYNKKKAAFSTYFWTFVLNYCRNTLRRERTKAGMALGNALGLEETAMGGDKDWSQQTGVLFLDLFEPGNWADKFERTSFMKKLITEMESPRYSRAESISKTGLERSTKNVVLFFLEGHSITKIASKSCLDTSQAWVRNRLRSLRSIKWLREYSHGF